MQYILEQGVCHGTVFNSCHTSSASKKNPLTEIQEGELYLCLEHRTVRVRERKIGIGVVSVRLTLTEKRLIVRISDNGVGMEPETLHQLQKELCRTAYDYIDSGRGTGIALLNVNNRIRLLFGEQYGITICSTPGLGTDVTVTLPAKHEGRA